MCGIAGAFCQPDGEQVVRTMVERIAHRGPDAVRRAGGHGRGRRGCTWAHRRLSIIDLSAAADQPFVKDGLSLSYNGELYNYRELRASLQGHGVRFVTQSDTEVVLEALRLWGVDALRRFRGMFAFALFDERRGSLLLARDPLGIKPLYVMPRGRGGRSSPPSSRRSSRPSATSWPSTRGRSSRPRSSTSCPRTSRPSRASSSCRRAPGPGGSTARRRGRSGTGTRSRRPHGPRRSRPPTWPPSSRNRWRPTSWPTCRSPRSSAAASTPASSRRSRPAATPAIEAYTITFRAEDQRLEAMPDDAVYARKMAAHLGITLHEIEISPDVVDMLPRIVEVLDEPIGDPAAINTVLMCQAARDAGVKVLLSGMGADELFGGYRKHLACVLGARYQGLVPRALRSRVVAPSVDRLPVAARGRGLRYSRWAKRFLTFAELPEEAAFRRSYTLYDREELLDLLDPALSGHVARRDRRAPRAVHRRRPGRPRQPDVPDRHAGCSCRRSTSRTRTGPAWRRRPRSASRSSTRWSSGRVHLPGPPQDPGA